MPPKSGKKKLTKAEKEKLKKEEAERKAREEEEARVLAEKEEAAKKEQEKQEAEERRRLENELRAELEKLEFVERKKRKGQLQELDSLWDSNRSTLFNEQSDRRQKYKWARYMRCDGSPDPTVQGEINTYMNLWREDQEKTEIETVLRDSQLALSLVEELTFVRGDTPEEELSPDQAQVYKNTSRELQVLLQAKLDLASHDLFLKATQLQNTETLNLQEVIGNDQITLCAWGNLSKNPRIKSHEFTETGFTFEIPRILTLSDCAVRVLFTKYDHFSEHSISYLPRYKKPIEEPVEEEVPVEDGEAKPEGEDGAEGGEDNGEDPINREETQRKVRKAKSRSHPRKSKKSKNKHKKDVMAALNALDDDQEEAELPVEEEKEEEEPMEEDVEIKTPEPEEFEDFDGDEDAVDLRAYQVLGGVFHFNLLQLPPQPKTTNNWVITQIVDPPALEYIEYIADNQPTGTPTSETKKSDEPKKDAEKPPIGVTVGLPQNVYFSEEPQVVRWDYIENVWRLDGFADHKFDEEKRLLSFKASYFGTMALIQDTHINMPFQSWELRPRAPNHAQLTIIAAIIEVEIQIKDDLCCLSQPEDKPELAHMLGTWYPVNTFIKTMVAAGLNLFPTVDSTKYVTIQNKNAITEERMYQQMALTSSTMAYSWSKWNNDVPDLGTERVIIQATEHLKDEPLMEDDWSLWMVTKKRTTKLKMLEYDDAFAEDHAEGTEFNADMYHMTMELASEEGQERIRATNHKFIDSIYTMLKSTKLLTYS